jgi:D-glycero-alpha-D-manno-heptose-7-phosphate kinase
MIISRAPLRISFLGGGTDLKDFYSRYPGRVISTTIDKFVYIVVNPGVLLNQFIIKYTETEHAKHPREFKHNLFREALLKLNISQSLEIASFAELPARTGLGSSSSFSVALLKALYAFLGRAVSKAEAARAASELEIEILKDPIGKQDHYAAAFGGFNIFQFNSDGTVEVEQVFLDFQARAALESHLLLYYTGMTRSASSVLLDQRGKILENFETYKKMSDSVLEFKKKLLAGDLKGMAGMLHEGWLMKKSLSSKISNSEINDLYEAGLNAGAFGGKVLGAGGGGCLLLVAPPEKHGQIVAALDQTAAAAGLLDSCRIPLKLIQSGADILFNSTTSNYA